MTSIAATMRTGILESGAGVEDLYKEFLAISQELGSPWHLSMVVAQFASLVAVQQQPRRAARLFGAAALVNETFRTRPIPLVEELFLKCVELARSALGEGAIAVAMAEGQAMARRRPSPRPWRSKLLARSADEASCEHWAPAAERCTPARTNRRAPSRSGSKRWPPSSRVARPTGRSPRNWLFRAASFGHALAGLGRKVLTGVDDDCWWRPPKRRQFVQPLRCASRLRPA